MLLKPYELVLADEPTGNLDYKKFEIGGAKSVKKKESDPYYISNDFSLIYFSCI